MLTVFSTVLKAVPVSEQGQNTLESQIILKLSYVCFISIFPVILQLDNLY